MAKITQKELLHIAQLSHIKLTEQELPSLVADIDAVLTYAARVSEIAADIDEPTKKNVNVMRDDVVQSTPPEPILAQAPERVHNYIVVPVIIEHNE